MWSEGKGKSVRNNLDSISLAQIIAEEVHDTKGQDIKILELKDLVSYTDYFILATGTSNRHVQAMADKVNLKLKHEYHQLPLTFEGYEMGAWVLLDYGDVVVHIFQEEQRSFYALDDFWVDAPQIPLAGSNGKQAKVKTQ